MIDIEECKKIFLDYVSNYNTNEFIISRKIEHTMGVLNISKEIAESLNLSKEEVDLATLIGLLHDIGRFEQAKISGTYKDSENVNHATIGVKILFEENKIEEFIPTTREYDNIIKNAVNEHNKLKIKDGLTEKEYLFAKIIRDADKLDIYRLFLLDNVLNMGTDSGFSDTTHFSKEVLEAFYNNKQIHKKELKTMLDWFLNSIAFTYDINFKKSFEILKEKDYINKIIDIGIDLWKEQESEFEKIRIHINNYIKNKII